MLSLLFRKRSAKLQAGYKINILWVVTFDSQITHEKSCQELGSSWGWWSPPPWLCGHLFMHVHLAFFVVKNLRTSNPSPPCLNPLDAKGFNNGKPTNNNKNLGAYKFSMMVIVPTKINQKNTCESFETFCNERATQHVNH